MRAEGGRPERRAPARGEGRRQSGRGADRADDDRAAPSRRTSPAVQTLHDVLTAALRQRVARDPRSPPPCGPYLRALPGCASGPGAADAVGWRDGGLWGVLPGAAGRRRGAPGRLSAAWSSIGNGRSRAEPDAGGALVLQSCARCREPPQYGSIAPCCCTARRRREVHGHARPCPATSCAFTALGAILFGIEHREHSNERWLGVSHRCHTGCGEGGAGRVSQGRGQWPQALGPPHGARRVVASVSSGKDTPCPDRPRQAPVACARAPSAKAP